MGKAGVAIVVMAFGLQGCAGALVYGESRKVNREALTPVVTAEYPDLAADAATDCIVKGMTVGETLSLPNSDSVAAPEALISLVREVGARPGVGDCLDAAGKVAM